MNVKSMLQTVRILDENQQVSLTNLAVYVVIIKLALSPAQPVDAVMLLLSLLNYSYKKVLNKSNTEEVAAIQEQMQEQLVEVKKEVEQAKAVANQVSLKLGMRGN